MFPILLSYKRTTGWQIIKSFKKLNQYNSAIITVFICSWSRFSAVSLKVTFNRWRTVVSATWKYDDPRLNMSHEGAARVWHVQPRVIIFPCRTNYRVSYVLSSVQLQESWIICKLKSFSPLYLHDLNTQDRRVIFGVSKTLCDLGHKNSFTEE